MIPGDSMRSLKEYSLARLLIVGFGIGMVIGGLRIAERELLPATAWAPLVTSIAAGIVIAGTLTYFSTGGRDQQLLPKAKQDS